MFNYKKIRKDFNLTQIEAAKACGVSLNTWCLWERGGGNPNLENMAKIREVFKILPFTNNEGLENEEA